jgi:hypothetical protein
MGKSLGMTSGGLDFEKFMKAIVAVPRDAVKQLKKRKARRKRSDAKSQETKHQT